MKNEFYTDEKNEQLIEIINSKLNEFCFGEYKNDLQYLVALTKSLVTVGDKQISFDISCRLRKNKNGMIKNALIYINETEEKKLNEY